MNGLRSAGIQRQLERATELLRWILDDDLRPYGVSLDDARAELARIITELKSHGAVRLAVTA